MEVASCTRACVGSSLSPSYRPVSSLFLRSQQFSAKPSKLCSCAAERNLSCCNRNLTVDPSSRQVFPNPNSSIRSRSSVCHALDGNSTSSSSSTTADADPPTPDQEQEGDNVVEYEEPDNIGTALNQIRQERLVSGEQSPSKTEEFWRGVLEEIRLIEWPSLQKVLGTTGVVTGIIIGSSLVLLTVNALLAQLSDAVFNNAPPA